MNCTSCVLMPILMPLFLFVLRHMHMPASGAHARSSAHPLIRSSAQGTQLKASLLALAFHVQCILCCSQFRLQCLLGQERDPPVRHRRDIDNSTLATSGPASPAT
ncbi:hypothetical protein GGR56DRAFT_245937 [Xylariaceae sp. FL0804]|nr:hypothetical protein GGR56DRAFT_245937 [Xylariaceae sp. FL0804]